MTKNANEGLLELFRGHGVEALLQDEWIVFPGRSVKASAELYGQASHEAATSVQLDVRVQNASGRAIVESFAGLGTTADEAVADAMQNFVVNSFHVLLAAFFGVSGQQVAQEKWVSGGKPCRVTIGNVGVRGEPPVEGEALVAWFDHFTEKLRQKQFAAGTHWVRVFYAQMQNEALACEVLLNNEVWEEMQSEMAAIDWPAGEAFYSLRLFVVIQVKKGKA